MISRESIENIVKKLKTRKSKNIIYLILVVLAVGAFSYRFYTVFSEGNTEVFNIARNDLKNGTPVRVLTANQIDGILYEPITVKNNRAYVSGARVAMFKSGQSLGDCKIVSVSRNIDLDSGMYVIKTSQCSDGLKYAQNQQNGFYIPISAIHENAVYVADSGVARVRNVSIIGRDYQNVLVDSGVNNGDLIILSNVKDGQKIKIVK